MKRIVFASVCVAMLAWVPAIVSADGSIGSFDFEVYRVRGDISGETSLTDNMWEGIEEKFTPKKGRFTFFTIANLTVGDVEFTATEKGWRWDGREKPPAGSGIEKMAGTTISLFQGKRFEMTIGSNQPIEYFEDVSTHLPPFLTTILSSPKLGKPLVQKSPTPATAVKSGSTLVITEQADAGNETETLLELSEMQMQMHMKAAAQEQEYDRLLLDLTRAREDYAKAIQKQWEESAQAREKFATALQNQQQQYAKATQDMANAGQFEQVVERIKGIQEQVEERIKEIQEMLDSAQFEQLQERIGGIQEQVEEAAKKVHEMLNSDRWKDLEKDLRVVEEKLKGSAGAVTRIVRYGGGYGGGGGSYGGGGYGGGYGGRVFMHKVSDEHPGITVSAMAETGKSGRVVLRNLRILTTTIEERKPLEGISLNVGPPIFKSEELNTSFSLKPGVNYGVQLLTEGNGVLMIRMRVDAES